MKEGCPSDYELEELSLGLIAQDWRKLGRRLKLEEARMRAFHKENEILSDKAFKMLLCWRRIMGSNATYRVLYDALCSELVARKDIAEQICLSQEGN